MTSSLIRPDLESLSAYATIEKALPYRLHANESPWDWLKEYQDEIVEIVMSTAFNHYPDGGSRELRKVLADYTGASPEQITMGCGSDELIKMVAEIFLSPGDAVVVHTPTFSEYNVAAMICSAPVFEVPSGQDFAIDVEAIIEKVNAVGAKMVFLCVPNNPTGTSLGRQQVLDVLNRTQAIVVCDEAYYEFCGTTVVSEARAEDRLIVLRTLSKAFGLAGLRVGYAVSTEQTADCLNRVRMPYNLNSLTQNLASLALRHRGRMRQLADQICAERERLYQATLGIPGLEVFPSGANFLLFRTPQAVQVSELLEGQGILTRLFRQEVMKDCLRINIGTPENNRLILDALREVNHAQR